MSAPKDLRPSKENILFVTHDSTHRDYASCCRAIQLLHSDSSLEYQTYVMDVAGVDARTLQSLQSRALPILISQELDVDPKLYAEYIQVFSDESSSNAMREKLYNAIKNAKVRFGVYDGGNAVMLLQTKVRQEVVQGRAPGYQNKATGHAYKTRFVYQDLKDSTPLPLEVGRNSMAFDAMHPESDFWGNDLAQTAEDPLAGHREVDRWRSS